MDYELAKELKDAGFRQDLERKPIWVRDLDGTMLTLPTLSELIEACRGSFFRLTYADGWEASSDSGGKWTYVGGLTPEEAVAYLWLALNKK